MRIILLFFFFLFSITLHAEDPYPVLVSIAPQKFLVDRIGGSTTQVQILVPENMSSHSYEPTLRQMIRARSAKVWFCIGEGFETTLYESFRSAMILIDAREGLPLLQNSCSHSKCSHVPFDPHIWLSCPLLKKQAMQIAQHLSHALPHHKEFYASNLEKILLEIDQLDNEITLLLKNHQGKAMLVAHPAFGYFCHDYHLVQLAVEVSGKEPSPKQLTSLINAAKEAQVAAIFTQKQYPLRGALRIQEALDVQLVQINPYEEHVLNNLRFIAEAFCSHG